ncbi:Arm DNA-binding domain-containing protein [Brumimicrobium sp.]|uniref:Arm DNA-binding domain-containing protein n=1 Tax=Brumimicrobium sp. TaxID=2029867 RepID=UPI003A9081C9
MYVRITINGKLTKFSLLRSFTTPLWDSTKSRLKGSSLEARQINTYLAQVLIEINDAYRQLLKEKKLITPHFVKARYLGEDEINKALLQLSAYHNTNMKSVLKPGTSYSVSIILDIQ